MIKTIRVTKSTLHSDLKELGEFSRTLPNDRCCKIYLHDSPAIENSPVYFMRLTGTTTPTGRWRSFAKNEIISYYTQHLSKYISLELL